MSGTLQGVQQLGVTIKPLTRPVAMEHTWSPFKAGWSTTRDDLDRELHQHGAQVTVLEVDLVPADFKSDGGVRADRRSPRSPGVRLAFRATAVSGSPVITLDAGEFSSWEDNVRALALSLESLRRAERYGVLKRGEQYRGLQLTSGGPDPDRGRALIARLGGKAAALRATHPDTRDPEQGYTDGDFADVRAAG